MGEFEDFIKAKYPVDYESLKEKYPNVPIVEFYGDEQDVWDFQQSKIEQLEKERAELRNKIKSQIELLESASKSRIAYNERERNILKSQADDLEGILRGECG